MIYNKNVAQKISVYLAYPSATSYTNMHRDTLNFFATGYAIYRIFWNVTQLQHLFLIIQHIAYPYPVAKQFSICVSVYDGYANFFWVYRKFSQKSIFFVRNWKFRHLVLNLGRLWFSRKTLLNQRYLLFL